MPTRLGPLPLLLLSRPLDIIHILDFLLTAHTILEASHTLLTSLINPLLALLKVIPILVGLLGRLLLLMLVPHARGDVSHAVAAARLNQLAHLRQLVHAVRLLPLVEAPALEAGRNLDAALAGDEARAL